MKRIFDIRIVIDDEETSIDEITDILFDNVSEGSCEEVTTKELNK